LSGRPALTTLDTSGHNRHTASPIRRTIERFLLAVHVCNAQAGADCAGIRSSRPASRRFFVRTPRRPQQFLHPDSSTTDRRLIPDPALNPES
jgi:hypothetical protein